MRPRTAAIAALHRTAVRVYADFSPPPRCGLLNAHQDVAGAWTRTAVLAIAVPAIDLRPWIPISGDDMVTKQDDAFVLKNLLALAALEALGGAIALGFAFNLLT